MHARPGVQTHCASMQAQASHLATTAVLTLRPAYLLSSSAMWERTSTRSKARWKRSGSMPMGKAATRVKDPLSSTPSGVPYTPSCQLRPIQANSGLLFHALLCGCKNDVKHACHSDRMDSSSVEVTRPQARQWLLWPAMMIGPSVSTIQTSRIASGHGTMSIVFHSQAAVSLETPEDAAG